MTKKITFFSSLKLNRNCYINSQSIEENYAIHEQYLISCTPLYLVDVGRHITTNTMMYAFGLDSHRHGSGFYACHKDSIPMWFENYISLFSSFDSHHLVVSICRNSSSTFMEHAFTPHKQVIYWKPIRRR